MRIRTALSFAIALASVTLTASVGRADINICNKTAETLFVLYVVPSDECESGQQEKLSLLSPTSCVTPYSASAKNETFYYSAWSQTSDAMWDGDVGIWIPYTPVDGADSTDNNWCMPTISCHPSSGSVCGDGELYNMRQKTPSVANYTLSLVP